MTSAATDVSGTIDYANPQKSKRKKRRIFVWAFGTIVIGVMGVAVFLPSLCRPRETANRVKCASNLRQIGQAILIYANAHGGQYPPSLATLAESTDVAPEMMICPSSNDVKSLAADAAGVVADLTAAETNAPGHKPCLSYVYVGRDFNAKTVKETEIVAYEPLENHEGQGTNALFGDGHVEFFGKVGWPEAAARGGLKLPAQTP